MVRKTREQVWSELDAMGEDEVRARIASNPESAEQTGLVQEWLAQKERVTTALATTASEVKARQATLAGRLPRFLGGLALVGIAAVVLAIALARRRR